MDLIQHLIVYRKMMDLIQYLIFYLKMMDLIQYLILLGFATKKLSQEA